MPKSDLILLALDESPTLQLLERALRAASYSTAIVHDRAALDRILQDSSPALLIIGERIKNEEGMLVAKALLERFPTLPILLFTEHDTPNLVKEALHTGVSGYLYPPLHTNDIVNDVQHSLQRARHMGDWIRREIKRTTTSLERRVSELETLVKLGRAVTSTLDLDSVLTNVVAAAVELTGAEEGSLLLLDEAGDELYMKASHNFEEGFARSFRLPVRDTLAGKVIRTGKPLVLNEAEPQKIMTAYLIHALIYVPLRLQHRVIGVLGVDNRTPQYIFSDHHALQMSVLAEYASIAIENAHLYQISETERIKFEATITNIENGVMILDSEQRILLVNPAMRAAFGLNSAIVDGQPVLDAVPHPDLRALLSQNIQGRSKCHEITFDDGRVFSGLHTSIPGVGSAITMQDITYLKRLDRLKSDFVHTVSHDLRSPLTAVLGYTELLGRIGTLNDQQSEFLDRIKASVQNITALVNDLLDLSRVEAGFDARGESVQLGEVLRLTLDNLQNQIDEKKLHLHLELAFNLPPAQGNPIRLRQMLDNLVGNAIKYTPSGGDIYIKVRPEESQIIIQVTDTGPGILPADQPYIFDKFYRASNIPADVNGSGLGLAIVKSIVDSHSGRVWVESQINQGSTFFVVLPAHEPSTPP